MRQSVLFRSGSWFSGAALAALLAGAVSASPAAATTLDHLACPGDTCSASVIQDAINAAPPGVGILIPAGKYHGDITINKNVTLTANGLVVITGDNSAGNPGTVVSVLSPAVVRIDGITITGGYANTSKQWGGGIYNSGTLTVSNSIITGNNGASNEGGGIYNDRGGQLTVTGSFINENTSQYGGGIGNEGTLVLSGAAVIGNSAATNGGGLDNAYGGGATVTSTIFTGNESAGQYGGAIDNYETTLTVKDSTIGFNSAGKDGGGIYSYPGTNPASTVSLSNDTILRNTPDNCGGGASC